MIHSIGIDILFLILRTFTESTTTKFKCCSVNVRNIKNRISIPMECITKAEVKGGLLPGRKVVTVYFEKNKFKISLMNNAIGSDIQGQKENVERFC